jgi:rhodanese-related sulfurtransferase
MIFGADLPAMDAAAVPEDVYLLDVREADEWAAGHAPDAVHIPMSELAERAGEIPSDVEVYVICRVGSRSAQVTVALNNGGWQARNVDGGMMRWAEAGRPMVAKSGTNPQVL